MRLFLAILFVICSQLHGYAQSFPSPASLSTGQGLFGANDPNWQVSQQCFPTGTEPNPTNLSVIYAPAVILSGKPSVWIDPSTLPAPVNNGNWIGVNASAGNDDGGGCARYYRLTLDLPANCGTVSVTNPGAYTLTFDGYVDNTLMAVYVNGVNMGVPAGGSFAAGGQVTFTLPGPWLVGTNYIDVLVQNGAGGSPNPAGFLMVASPSAASSDSDGDGVNNLNDVCPCEAGSTANGCPPPNNCNVTAIRSAFIGAGCTELFTCYDGCSLYFYYPTAGSSQAAETFAQSLGGHVVSIQSANENACLQSELSSHGFGGVIWLGYTDDVSEGSFYWLDGSPMGYTNWAPGEPNNSGGNEDCVQMYPDGQWNDLNCSSGAASILEVGLCPQATVNSNTLQICAGGSATFSVSTLFGSAPYTYSWSPATSLSSNTSSNPVASPSVTTIYTVQSIDRYGCRAFAYVTLTVNATPPVTANIAAICKGIQTATLIANGASSYSWSAGLSSTTGSLVTGTPTITTNYTVTGTSLLGCSKAIVTAIAVNALPIIAVNSETICKGQQSANLMATGANTYSWFPSSTLSFSTGSVVTANPQNTITYTVVGINGFGCPNYITSTVVVNPLPIITVPSASICIGQQSATLTASGASSYAWSPNISISALTGSAVVVSPTTSIVYSILGVDNNGCVNLTTTNLTVLALPILSANDTIVCLGQQTATLTASGASTYTWFPSSMITGSSIGASIVTTTLSSPTVFTVLGVDVNGCYDFTTTIVNVNPLPVLSITSSSICLNQYPANMLVLGANTYTWFPAVTYNQPDGSDVDANPTVPTDYTVVGTDANGCVNSGTTNVGFYVIPTASLTVTDSVICIGNSLVLTPSGGTSFELHPDNLFTLDVFSLSPQSTTSYTVIAYSDDGCYSENNPVITVTVNPLPLVSAFTNTTINIGQTTLIGASGAVTYDWNPTTGLNCSTCASTNARPLETTVYIVSGTDANGCINQASVTITVDYICGEYFVPNVFTPNGDGQNDFVNLHSACISTYVLQIFDRWGEKVFETSDVNQGWDGYFRGKPMDTGVFVYKAEGTALGGEKFSVKGNVTLLR